MESVTAIIMGVGLFSLSLALHLQNKEIKELKKLKNLESRIKRIENGIKERRRINYVK